MVVVVICLGAFLPDDIEGIGRNVVQVDEFHGRGGHHLTVPTSVAVVAALYLSARPLVARRE